jgi:heme/copper-type cytochrome/quinol oxidase subunit 2
MPLLHQTARAWLGALVFGALISGRVGVAPSSGATVRLQSDVPRRAFVVHARRYAFEPVRIQVAQDDLVVITFHADDISHSFTVDEYRISKRAAPGGAVQFEFRADRAGHFRFYCDLRADEGCRGMRGELIVTPR